MCRALLHHPTQLFIALDKFVYKTFVAPARYKFTHVPDIAEIKLCNAARSWWPTRAPWSTRAASTSDTLTRGIIPKKIIGDATPWMCVVYSQNTAYTQPH